MFESVLKTNSNLEFAVITGCLRISRESIFTGLNNLEINSVLNDNFAEHFGFTQPEVEEMLEFYEITEKTDEVKCWYDGYLFGNTEVYNPWSVVNYVKTAVTNTITFPKPYWSNTSSNSIIREWFEQKQKSCDMTPLYEGIKRGNCKQIEEFIGNQLAGSISYYDSVENFYHGYMVGVLSGIGGCDKALKQIEDQNYSAELIDEGYQKVLKYGICFCRKSCMVKIEGN